MFRRFCIEMIIVINVTQTTGVYRDAFVAET